MLSTARRSIRPVSVRIVGHRLSSSAAKHGLAKRNWGCLGIGTAVAVGGAVAFQVKAPTCAEETLPIYTARELEQMVASGRLVSAYRGHLYDMTSFTGHPGGVGRLQMASGKDLEVFWKVYTQHNRGHITENLMIPYRIARVSDKDMKAITKNTFYDTSVYDRDPDPSTFPDLLCNTRYPFNAEGRLSLLTEKWQTPVGRHFVRNHNAVPVIDPAEYELTVSGKGCKETTFTLKDLKTKFPKVDVTTVIQCNGNRREDYHYYDGETPAFGPPHWVAGAIGNATWSGARLRDVLRASGMDVDAISLGKAPLTATQIGLLGMDIDEVGNQYCCSFPFDKGIDPFGDVLVAYQMNGEDIPRSHGYPVRCIVPGHAGARNCKFLEKVEVTDTPCHGTSNWKQYAVHAPDVPLVKIAEFDNHHEELMGDPPVQEMPVQSLITNPSAGDIIAAVKNGVKTVKVKGIAWGGGGSGINRVDVSLDDGKTFTRASVLDNPIVQRRRSEWAWKFFEKEITIPDAMRWKLQDGQRVEMVLTSKALNTAWNMQPESPNPNINAHGCCVNHWYRVPVTLCPHVSDHVKSPDGDFGNKPSGGRFAAPFRNWDQPSEAEKRLATERSRIAAGVLCTCGSNCKPGCGCLAARFDTSPSKLFERMQRP